MEKIYVAKIVLDACKNRVDKAFGSRNSYPENYEKAQKDYELVRQKFEELVDEWIAENCKK